MIQIYPFYSKVYTLKKAKSTNQPTKPNQTKPTKPNQTNQTKHNCEQRNMQPNKQRIRIRPAAA
jgi:hypothetical protein